MTPWAWLLLGWSAVSGSTSWEPTTGRLSQDADCREYDRVEYSAPTEEALRDIRLVSRATDDELAGLKSQERHASPHGTATFVALAPDYLKDGPWNTTIHVLGNKARPLHLEVHVTNHGNGGVRPSWINEHLLVLQVWRGRIESTDLILDVDAAEFIYRQSANYLPLILPCREKVREPK